MTARRTALRLRVAAAVTPLLLLVSVSCGGGQQPTPTATPRTSTSTNNLVEINAATALNTFDTRFIQIDACPNAFPPFNDTAGCSGANWSGDANLVLGNDNDLLTNIGKTAVPAPQPSSGSVNFPTGSGTPTYIDWSDLTSDANTFANHFRSDFTAGTDPTAFPGSDSCVGPANVLDKMNLTFVSVSNNTQYAYFGVQRRDNSGDAGYMWIFNKLPPPSFGNEQSLLGVNDGLGDNCGANEYPLTFKVSKGDILFKGHFAPSSTIPLLAVFSVNANIVAGDTVADGNTVFTATCDPPSGPCYFILPAKTAINWQITYNGTGTLWTEQTGFVSAAAANTSIAGLAGTGSAGANNIGGVGLKSPIANLASYKTSDGNTWKCTDPNGCMPDDLFAEVAVPVAAFTQGSVCGATFYGSVISRSSGTTPSPDMKDLAGPFQFNFGNASVTEVITPTCGSGTGNSAVAQFKYHLGAFTGLSGASGTPTSCKWFIDCPAAGCDVNTAPACDTTHTSNCYFSTSCNTTDASATASSGAHSVTLFATDGTCPATSSPATFTINPPPSVTATMTSACTNFGTAAAPLVGFTYSAAPSGVAGTASYLWGFTGLFTGSASDVGPTSIDNISVATTYTGTAVNGALTLYDKRTGVAGVACKSPDTSTNCCTATDSKSTIPYLPLGVAIAPNSGGSSCTVQGFAGPNGDAITFAPTTLTGGSGHYTYSWTNGSLGALTTGTCTEGNTTSSSCTFTPDDSTFCATQTFKLTVGDLCASSNTPTGCASVPQAGSQCLAATSNQNSYSKTTTVTATNN